MVMNGEYIRISKGAAVAYLKVLWENSPVWKSRNTST